MIRSCILIFCCSKIKILNLAPSNNNEGVSSRERPCPCFNDHSWLKCGSPPSGKITATLKTSRDRIPSEPLYSPGNPNPWSCDLSSQRLHRHKDATYSPFQDNSNQASYYHQFHKHPPNEMGVTSCKHQFSYGHHWESNRSLPFQNKKIHTSTQFTTIFFLLHPKSFILGSLLNGLSSNGSLTINLFGKQV